MNLLSFYIVTMKKSKQKTPEIKMTKTEFALAVFPGRSDEYARRLLHDYIMNRRLVMRRLIDLGWRPYDKNLDKRQMRYLQKVIAENVIGGNDLRLKKRSLKKQQTR